MTKNNYPATADAALRRPLDGIRVIEVASWMAAPSAAAALADMGADVIKVEPIGGDPARGMVRPAQSQIGDHTVDASFHMDNRGKRSVAIALDDPVGVDIVRTLVASAHIFLTNLLPHRQLRFGLDAKSLLAVKADLVHGTVSGYGPTGPDADRAGFDLTSFFGRGAVTDLATQPDAYPPAPIVAQGDHTTGLAMIAGLLAALRMAESSGRGQVLDVNLLAAAAWTLSTELAPVLVDGRMPHKRDRFHARTALQNRLRCSDGRWIIVNMPEARWWPKFCDAVGRSEWTTDARFLTAADRYRNMPEIVALLDELFATKTLAAWGELLDRDKLIWAPVATMSELADDPQAASIGLFPTINTTTDTFRTIAVPFSIEGAGVGPRGPAPELGADTLEVLTECGWDAVQISQLADAGIVRYNSPTPTTTLLR